MVLIGVSTSLPGPIALTSNSYCTMRAEEEQAIYVTEVTYPCSTD